MHPLPCTCSNRRRTKLPPIPLLGVAHLLLLCIASPTSSCTQEEKISLLKFLEGLSHGSGLTTLWQNETNCCMWEGITCDTDGLVTETSLASMGLEGSISPSLGNLTSLLSLNLSHNSLSGQIPAELLLHRSIVALDVSFNNLHGDLHKLPSILGRDMERDIPDDLYNATSLEHLSFPNNQLHGTLSPENIVKLSNLVTINLANNELSGKIPDSIGQLKRLEELHLKYNSMFGELPSNLSKCSNLKTTILGSNIFHGQLKKFNFSTLSKLEILDIMSNKFTGIVPESLYFCNNLIALRLPSNNFQGQLSPRIGNLKSLKFLSLSNNSFTNITHALQVLKSFENLTTLLIGTNFRGEAMPEDETVDGQIPQQIGNLKALTALNLSFNNLHGEVPQSISNLTNLQLLDLSNNHLTGEIPTALENLHFLSEFNISNNNLEGPIPTGGQFSTYPDSSFVGNPNMCGPMIIHHHCNAVEAGPAPTVSKDLCGADIVLTVSFAVFVGVGVLYDQIVLSRYFG
ncbi:hypothetical protein EJB05_25234 [Eragrostis curvula]|uniref:Leucine-rich repeat-containing N-terminal plant-type domain-containing protein n=1 Tax=Eragrostis curvula TaxID=38414 RepID=A0A5J9VDC8_9POAL|nr:hypothetical protein EJB05_25234 [Eragrostis curvula]